MDFIALKALACALLPPLDALLVAGLGLSLLVFGRKTGWPLLIASLGGLFVLSMPLIATGLAGFLESRAALRVEIPGDAQVIVILGAGSYQAAPEYGGDTVSVFTLERLRWGVRLHRMTGLPILLSGGTPYGTRTSEAMQMKTALSEDFRAEAKWLEEKSSNTFESALYVKEQLATAKVDRILLVTHALHMRRARMAFEHAGFRVIEAPTGFSTLRPPGILNFMPSSQGLDLSRACLHEILGLGWYHVRLATAKS